MSHGQPSLERGFSFNKEGVAPNLEELKLTSIRVVQNSMLVNNMKVADFVITEDLLSSCSHASSRNKMYMMENKTDKEQTEKAKKRKDLQELRVSKKKKKELQRVAEQMFEAADKKAKEAEKGKDTVGMKAHLMESNASRDKLKRDQGKRPTSTRQVNRTKS